MVNIELCAGLVELCLVDQALRNLGADKGNDELTIERGSVAHHSVGIGLDCGQKEELLTVELLRNRIQRGDDVLIVEVRVGSDLNDCGVRSLTEREPAERKSPHAELFVEGPCNSVRVKPGT